MEKLGDLCAEIRAFLLESVGTTGGHLGSNLGVVELTDCAALHLRLPARSPHLGRLAPGVPAQDPDGAAQALRQAARHGRHVRLHQSDRVGVRPLPHRPRGQRASAWAWASLPERCTRPIRRYVVTVIGDASLGAGRCLRGLEQRGRARPAHARDPERQRVVDLEIRRRDGALPLAHPLEPVDAARGARDEEPLARDPGDRAARRSRARAARRGHAARGRARARVRGARRHLRGADRRARREAPRRDAPARVAPRRRGAAPLAHREGQGTPQGTRAPRARARRQGRDASGRRRARRAWRVRPRAGPRRLRGRRPSLRR